MTDDHISDLRWDRMFGGELSASDGDAARAHAASCARCGARLRELEAERAAFALRPRAVVFAKPRRSPWWRSGFAGVTGLAAVLAAAVVLVVVLRPRDGGGERAKGAAGPALLLAAGPRDHLAPLAERDTIHTGDSLQAGYTATRDGFGAVLSVDGAGQANVYVPSRGQALVALPAGAERSFPESTILDAVTGQERVAIVWCETARPVAPLLEELRTTQSLAERDGCTIRLVVLSKVAR